MKAKKMTKLQILNDTIKYYGVDPAKRRSSKMVNGEEKCRFTIGVKNKKHCAVGRFFKLTLKTNKFEWNEYVIDDVDSELTLNKVLVSKVHGHSLSFWKDLQKLHDSISNWDRKNGGLSESGQGLVENIKNNIRDKIYK